MSRHPPEDTVFGLIDAALRLPADAREAWIRSGAADDRVRAEALAMLAVVSGDAAAVDVHAQPPHPSLRDAQIGDFRVIRPLGGGAGGVVYEAEQRAPRRRVALKVLRHTGLAAGERAAAEAQAAANVRHPGIAGVIAAGTAPAPGGSVAAWIAMDLVEDAVTIVERCAAESSRARVLGLLLGAAEAIAAAHRAGILHRDIKPANLLVGKDGAPRVVDFGVAATAAGRMEPAGTPRWMAPECCDGGPATARSDVWSFGTVIRECCDASGIGASSPLRSVARMATEHDPNGRYADAGELAEDLRRIRDGEEARCEPRGAAARSLAALRRRPRRAAAAAVAAVVAAALGSMALYRSAVDAAMLFDLHRTLALHDDIANMIDALPAAERPAAAARAERRAREDMHDPEHGPGSVLNSITTLVRLGRLEAACSIARESLAVLRAEGAPEDSIRWIAVMADACLASEPGDRSGELEALARSATAIASRSPADDLLLGCYIEAVVVQSGNARFRTLAAALDASHNPDPGASAATTMLALVAMDAPGAVCPDARRLASIEAGIRRWSEWPMREFNAVIYMNRAIEAMRAAAARGDRAFVGNAAPLARLAAARSERTDAIVVTEIWIGICLADSGDDPGAGATLDAVADRADLGELEAERVVAWLPHRVALALRSDDAAREVDVILERVRRQPLLETADPELAAVLRSWRSGSADSRRMLDAWRGVPRGSATGWRARVAADIAGRLSPIIGPD